MGEQKMFLSFIFLTKKKVKSFYILKLIKSMVIYANFYCTYKIHNNKLFVYSI